MLPRLRGEASRGAPPPDDGFVDRFLLVFPATPPAAGERWRQVSEEALAAWQTVVERLLSLEMVADGERGPRPFYVRLTAGGREEWQRFTDEHAAEVNAEDFPPHLAGPWAKMRGYMARLALVVHFLRWACGEAEGEDVDGDSAARAARLVDYFKAHARKAHALMDADPRVAEVRRLLHWLQERGQSRFSKRDAYQGLKGTFRKVEDLDAVLASAEKYVLVRPEAQPPTPRPGPGRKPSPLYEVNPALLGCIQQGLGNASLRAEGGVLPGDSVFDSGNSGKRPCRSRPGSAPTSGEGATPGITDHNSHYPQNGPRRAEPVGADRGSLLPGGHSGDSGNCGSTHLPATAYQLIVDSEGTATLAEELAGITLVAVDLETTGLCTRTDRVRLLSLAWRRGKETRVRLVDCYACDPAPVLAALADSELVAHNAKFDLAFLRRLGYEPAAAAHDTMLLAELLYAGQRPKVGLAACAGRELGLTLNKAQRPTPACAPGTAGRGGPVPPRYRRVPCRAGDGWG